MAKKEKLEALVPPEEQPYPVPENWRWVRLGGITEVVGGGTPSSGNKDYYENGDIPWISPADLSGYNDVYISCGAKNITNLGLQNSSARLMPKDTVCLSTRAPIGYVAIALNELATNQGFKSFLPAPCYLPHFLYWYLKGNKYMLESMASGTTFLELSGSKAATIKFPIAPLSEQQRIVDRIESLFAKLDEAKEKAQAVVDGFEDRKAAILHKAFTGELTEVIRKEKGVTKDCWKKVSLKEIVSGFKYGSSEKSDYQNEGMPVLRIPNIGDGEILFNDMKYLNHIDVDEQSQVHKDDILIIRSNGSRDLVGKCAIVPELHESYAYASFLIRIKPSQRVKSEYLVYFLNSSGARRQMFAKAKSSAGIHNINSKELGEVMFQLPPLWEQEEIVCRIEELIKQEAEAKTVANMTIEQIEKMKKSILAKAFRGELGTNDPAEQPVELSC